MTIKSAVFHALQAVGKPVHPVVAPLGSKPPYIRYCGIGGGDEATYDGDGMGASRGLIQVDAFAVSYGDADRLSQEARQKLYDDPTVTVGEITDLPDDQEDDTKLYRVSFQVEAWA